MFTYGERKKKGQRTDVAQTVSLLKESKGDMKAVMDTMPEVFVKYPNGLNQLSKHYIPRPAFRSVIVQILNGPTGFGKSHMPACIHGEANVYYLNEDVYKSGFWRGYEGHTTLVFEEYTHPWVKPSQLLQLLDGSVQALCGNG